MSGREKAIFAPLIAMTLILGIYPSLVTDIIGPSVSQLVDRLPRIDSGGRDRRSRDALRTGP
jgi:NADH:ubiquinone oxidoreductase subunit 4 (subunit M)